MTDTTIAPNLGLGQLTTGGQGQFFPLTPNTAFTFPPSPPEFRVVDNGIEGKVWFELDVSRANTIVIIQGDEKVEMDKKDFLQRIGLEW